VRIPLSDFRRVIGELAALRDRHIDNIYQCGPRTFVLKLQPGKVTLLLELESGRARVVVTDEPPPVPEQPPVFAAILRSALRGARVLGVGMPAEDRVAVLDVGTADGPRRLVVEALGRHGNLLLLDADGTVERVLDGAAARHRGNPIGAPYTLPDPPHFPDEASLLPDELPDEPFAANLALDRLARGEQDVASGEAARRRQEKTLARLRKARSGAHNDMRELADPTQLRRQGELLLTHYADLKQGMKSFKGVALDARLAPAENIDRIFARARKAVRAGPILAERVAGLDDLIARAEAGETIPERQIPGRKPGPQPPRRPYKVFESADGHRILVGKGGRDNDETTLKVAGPHDLFLHVRGTPGAHVIVPLRKGEAVPEQTLLDAAHLALHYSKSRHSRSADVTYTPRRNVSKPKGAKPGLVQVRQEKVLRLRREPERLARVLMNASDPE